MSDPDELRGDDARVRALLRRLPHPQMPPEVADRIDAAVRAAAPSTSAGLLQPDRPRVARWLARAVPVAASVAGVLVISGIAFSVLRPASSDVTGSAVETSSESGGPPASAPVVVESGRDYTKKQLPEQLDRTLTANPPPSSGPATSPPASSGVVGDVPRLGEQAQSCVAGLTQSTSVQPYLLDRATFDGRDALIVAVPGQVLPNTVEVFIVGRNCAGPNPRLLYYRVVDRAALPAIADLPTPSPTVS